MAIPDPSPLDPIKESLWGRIVADAPALASDDPDLAVVVLGARKLFDFAFDSGRSLGFAAGRQDAKLGQVLRDRDFSDKWTN